MPKISVDFLNRLKLNHLNNCGYEVYIAGDINIDFYKYHSDKFTSEFLDMLFDLGYMPLITKATRITDHSATVIDHIYSFYYYFFYLNIFEHLLQEQPLLI